MVDPIPAWIWIQAIPTLCSLENNSESVCGSTKKRHRNTSTPNRSGTGQKPVMTGQVVRSIMDDEGQAVSLAEF